MWTVIIFNYLSRRFSITVTETVRNKNSLQQSGNLTCWGHNLLDVLFFSPPQSNGSKWKTLLNDFICFFFFFCFIVDLTLLIITISVFYTQFRRFTFNSTVWQPYSTGCYYRCANSSSARKIVRRLDQKFGKTFRKLNLPIGFKWKKLSI